MDCLSISPNFTALRSAALASIVHARRGRIRLCLLFCLSGFVSIYGVDRAYAAEDVTQNVLPQPCATDPAYQEFEKSQIAAYESDDQDFRIFLDPNFQDKVLQDTIGHLRRRSHDRPKRFPREGGDIGNIQDDANRLRLPTCFENRAIYFIMSHLAGDVENARQQLGLPLHGKARFGSISSNDINAYTYLTADGKDGVIALNYQLFNFTRRMTELAAKAIDTDLKGLRLSQAQVITQGLLAVSYNNEAKNRFVKTLRGLLLGNPLGPSDIERMSADEEILVAFFVGAMDRFVFAHEYGHLIKNHLSGRTTIPIGVEGSQEFQVAARTWQQEFEADEVGLALLTEILLGSAQEYPKTAGYYVFALKAPLFLFDCLEFIDRERFMHDNHTMPGELSDGDKAVIRRCANGGISAQDKVRCETELHSAHPPAWLRRERLQVRIDKTLSHIPQEITGTTLEQKSDELLFSINLLWTETSTKILESFSKEPN